MYYEPGTQVGKYEIRGQLGKGAMGVVYVAHDPVLDRRVALKVMAANVLDDPDLKERFRREARAVARLQSPNVVTVHDFGYDRHGAPYIAMELLSGTDLEARMRESPPRLSEKLNVIAQVCRGLAHAHRAGIVHRDVKPANVFLTRSGLVKVMDFGTARLLQASHTQTGTVMGTVAYMSPEQIQGEKVDGRSDVFSVGILLYRLLCHQQPFGGENVHHVIYKILNVQPATLTLPEGRPIPSLQHIVDRALAKDLEQRYQTADQMADDVEAFLRDYTGSITDDTVFRTVPLHDGGPPPPGAETPTVRRPAEDAGVETIPPTQLLPPAGAAAVPPKRRWQAPVAVAAVLAVLAAGGYFLARSTGGGDVQVAERSAPAVEADATETPPTKTMETGTASGKPGGTDEDGAVQGVAEPADSPPELATPREDAGRPAPPPTTPPPTPTSPPPRAAQPPPPPAPTAAEHTAAAVRERVAEVRAALDDGELDRARELIEDGRSLDSGNPLWDQLADLQRAQARSLEGTRRLREGVDHFTAGRLDDAIAAYELAIAAFDQVAALDPGNPRALDGKVQAVRFKREAEEAKAKPAVAEDRFTAGPTVYTPDQPDAPAGFVQDDNVKAVRSTTGAGAPGELDLELNPESPQLGAPYALVVRLRNKSNGVLFARSLELVSSYKGREIGRGRPIDLGLRRVEPRGGVILHEVADSWSEELDQGGEITATVTLGDGGRLTKTLSWTPR